MTRGFGDIEAKKLKGKIVGYRAVVYINGKRRRGKLCPTRDAAKPWLRELRQRKVEEESGAAKRIRRGTAETITYTKAAEELLAWYEHGADRVYSRLTLSGYKKEVALIVRRFGATPVRLAAEEDHAGTWRTAMRKAGLAPQTIRNRLDRLAQLYALCAERGWIGEAPPAPRRPRPAAKTPRTAARESDVAECWARTTEPRARAALLLAADAGLRRFEIPQLDGRQVDLEAGWLRDVMGKGAKARTVPIRTQRLAVALRALDPRAGVPLLGACTSEAGLVHLLERGCGEHPGLHRCRHLCATRWANDVELPIHRVKVWLGHSRLSTTDGYISEHADAVLDACPLRYSPPAAHQGGLGARKSAS